MPVSMCVCFRKCAASLGTRWYVDIKSVTDAALLVLAAIKSTV